MKQTYVTTMPDHAGAFMAASEILSSLELNITRVSYNKAIDIHMLFIDVEGDDTAIRTATERLKAAGYLQSTGGIGSVILIEFKLLDVPGSVLPVLKLISGFNFNISYISSRQREGEEYQLFRMGLLVENGTDISEFIRKASLLCELRIIEYNETEKNLDNTVFYISFANRIAERIGLSESEKAELIVNSNLIMELLDKSASAPYKTFEFIGKFAEDLCAYRQDAFKPRITNYTFEDVQVTLIEPPCGSNICLLASEDGVLAVDSGFACYREEMRGLFRSLIPDFYERERAVIITHADVDHCGLLDEFPAVFVNGRCHNNFILENEGKDNEREKNPLHAPYIRISKILSRYTPPSPDRLKMVDTCCEHITEHFDYVGTVEFKNLRFEVYEGSGGHVAGECVLVERRLGIAFTGDIYVNIRSFIPEQAAFNRLAPYLMTSVDCDPAMSAKERAEIPALLGTGEWHIFGGHGAVSVSNH